MHLYHQCSPPIHTTPPPNMSDLQPLVLHGSGHTVNPWKVVLVIEELGLPYKVESHEFGDLKKEPFVKFNPNGRVPALIDPNQNNLTLWEVGTGVARCPYGYSTDTSVVVRRHHRLPD